MCARSSIYHEYDGMLQQQILRMTCIALLHLDLRNSLSLIWNSKVEPLHVNSRKLVPQLSLPVLMLPFQLVEAHCRKDKEEWIL